MLDRGLACLECVLAVHVDGLDAQRSTYRHNMHGARVYTECDST